MNRFYDIPFIPCRELLPWEIDRRGLEKGTGWFENMERWRFRSNIAAQGLGCEYVDIYMEVGEMSDLASIPSALQWAVMDSDDPRIAGGAWPHDKLFKAGGRISVTKPSGEVVPVKLSFTQCNMILCDEAMPDLRASKLDRWKVYRGLWIGGRSNFKD